MQVRCEPIMSGQFGARAIRPHYSVLSTAKYEQCGLPAPRRWQAALADYLADDSTASP
jgi:dTDP-4-dehydrorhamnose reductase